MFPLKWRDLVVALVASGLTAAIIGTFAVVRTNELRKEAEAMEALAQQHQQDAERERLRAEDNLRKAREVLDHHLTHVAANQPAAERTNEQLRQELLKQAAEFYRRLQEQGEEKP